MVFIRSNVTSIANLAFFNCRSLTNVYFDAREKLPSLGNACFNQNFTPSINTAYYYDNVFRSNGTTLANQAYFQSIGFANAEIRPDGISYEYRGGTVSEVEKEYVESVIIDSIVTTTNNAVIPDDAFSGCINLTSITIPPTITSLGTNTFENCISLPSITVPDSITVIPEGTFSGCTSLTTVSLGDITIMGNSSFANCTSLNSFSNISAFSISNVLRANRMAVGDLIIPSTVTTIGDYAFQNDISIITVTTSPALISIGQGAFDGCTSLTMIQLYNNLPDPSSIKSGSTTWQQYWGIANGVTIDYISPPPFGPINGVYYAPIVGSTVSASGFDAATLPAQLIIPSTVSDGTITYTVVSLDDYSFYGCTSLVSVRIPSSVITIGILAFDTCSSLASVIIPSSITTFGDQAFGNCQNLKSVTFEEGLTNIGNFAFVNCLSLASITIPSSITTIGDAAFQFCSFASVNVPSGLTTIGIDVFSGCTNLISITSDNVLYPAYNNVLYSNQNEIVVYPIGLSSPSYTIRPGTTSIYGGAFSFSKLTSINIPSSVTNIDVDGFNYCTNLVSVKFEDGLITIGSNAFNNCRRLVSVTIPSSVTTIGDYAFDSCDNLNTVNFDAINSLPQMESNSFGPNYVTAYYYEDVFQSDGTTPPNVEYFQNFGFADAQIRTTQSFICFKEGSKILTNKGYVAIEDLRKGDLVKTLLNDYVPVDMIGNMDIHHPAKKERIKDQLYKCTNDRYPEIFEDLVITGCHSILVDEFASEEQREKTIELTNYTYCTDSKYRLPACVDSRASVYETHGNYKIYHLALENDDYYMNYGIYANGLLVETCSKRYLIELSDMTLID
jgi:hypothetical protein